MAVYSFSIPFHGVSCESQDTCPSRLQNDAWGSCLAKSTRFTSREHQHGFGDLSPGAGFPCNAPALLGNTVGCASVYLHTHARFCACLHTYTLSKEAFGNFPPFPWAGWEAAEQGRRNTPALCCWPWGEGMLAVEGMDQGRSFPITLPQDSMVRVAFWGAAGVSQPIPLQKA